MLLFASKNSEQVVDGATRIPLLERLQERGMIPLIRSARLHCYELSLLGDARVREMERTIAAWSESSEASLYVRGDLFCFEDYALYLIFGDEENDLAGVRAGIVYEAETTEPLKKLDAFCHNIDEALMGALTGSATGQGAHELPVWKLQERSGQVVMSRFATTENVGAKAIDGEQSLEHGRAIEVLEDEKARRLLRRIGEETSPVRVSALVANDEREANTESLINRLASVGLLRREMLVSCRKGGRALFRLPSVDALQVITASNAVCSECGSNIADEKIEELIASTDTATKLLEENSWLASRFRSVLRELGVPDSEMAANSVAGESETQMMVSVSGETFLCVLKEGDLAAAHARRALEQFNETEAEHLVIATTGKLQDEARARLREHARRRARGGSAGELILIEGMETATAELQHAFERVSNRALARELFALDASLGLSVGYMIATRFRLLQKSGALQDLAESAIGAIAGSLREI